MSADPRHLPTWVCDGKPGHDHAPTINGNRDRCSECGRPPLARPRPRCAHGDDVCRREGCLQAERCLADVHAGEVAHALTELREASSAGVHGSITWAALYLAVAIVAAAALLSC